MAVRPLIRADRLQGVSASWDWSLVADSARAWRRYLKEGETLMSAKAKRMRPMQMAKAAAYSVTEKLRLLIIPAIIMVGISLQERNTTWARMR